MDIDFFWIGLGLAALGYFIGDGLKNFKNPKGSLSGYPTLIEEKDLYIYLGLSKEEVKDLYIYLGLSKEEVKDLLSKHPDAPKIELKGKTYYPYQHFIEWFSSEEFYKK